MQFPPQNPRSCPKTRTHCRHAHRGSPIHEAEVCRGREVSEADVTMGPFFENRADYLKGTCTRTPCEYWHPPECQFYKTKTGWKSGDTCLFPHYKVDKQPNKNPKKGHFPKRRESEDKNAVGDFHLVHGPGRHSLFLRPGHDLRSSFLHEKAVSERRFFAVLGKVHLSYWSFIVVRHGGHVHRDVFCFLFPWFAASFSFSNLFFSSFGVSFNPISWVSRDSITRASIALGPSEGALLMFTHSSR